MRKYFVCVFDKVVKIVVNTTDTTIFYNNEREKIKKKILSFFLKTLDKIILICYNSGTNRGKNISFVIILVVGSTRKSKGEYERFYVKEC